MRRSRWQRLACFADTGFFYALLDSGDRWHEEAKNLLQQIQQQNRFIVTSLLVVAEAHALMLYRLGSAVALEWITGLERWVELVEVEPAHRQRAQEILSQYSDQQFTLTDAVSFAIIEAHRLSIALSTDRHFGVFRGSYLTLPLMGTQLPEPTL